MDARNSMGPGPVHSLGLTVGHQDSLDAPRGVRIRVEVSYDDGGHFTKAATRPRGEGSFTATLPSPRARGDAFATLRVTAQDTAGNTVRQP